LPNWQRLNNSYPSKLLAVFLPANSLPKLNRILCSQSEPLVQVTKRLAKTAVYLSLANVAAQLAGVSLVPPASLGVAVPWAKSAEMVLPEAQRAIQDTYSVKTSVCLLAEIAVMMEPFVKPEANVMVTVDVPAAPEATATTSACQPKHPATINACPKAPYAAETDDTAWHDIRALMPASTVLLAAPEAPAVVTPPRLLPT
jgi:hypothetical protein